MLLQSLVLLTCAGAAFGAGRPKDMSICDYYTTALLKKNTAANQMTLLTLVVNTAEIGNYTQPNVGITVPGILNPNGMYGGHKVNLLPYFDGTLMSSNVNGKPKHVNFLDGGGAAALKKNMPAFHRGSNQYMLLTHLYEFFGILLGCSKVGTSGFPAYGGDPGMFNVHRFMNLDHIQLGYFIEQVGLSAASFGVADSDVKIVGDALTELFAYKCAPKTTVAPMQGAHTQSICIARGCQFDKKMACGMYPHHGTGKPPMPHKDLPAGAKKPKGVCPTELKGDYLEPSFIIPVSKSNPTTAYGPNPNGQISTDTRSLFSFYFPKSYKGKTCHLIFTFPSQTQLDKSGSTSGYGFSGLGEIKFSQLKKAPTEGTTYDTTPAVKATIMKTKVAPKGSYTLATYPCLSDATVGIEMQGVGDTYLDYYQDSEACPIGLFIKAH